MRWTRRLLVCLFLVPGLTLASLAQVPSETPTGEPLWPVLVLPTEQGQAKRLEAARDYLRVRDYPLALRQVQYLLDAPEDSLLRPRDGKESWRGVRAQAEQILEELDPQARDTYRTLYEPQARDLLQKARQKSDPQLLADIVRRLRFTPSGEEAQALLAGYYLDRGQDSAAARGYQALLRVTPAERQSVPVLLRATTAFRAAGLTPAAEQTWQALQRRAVGGKIDLGRRAFALADLEPSLGRITSADQTTAEARLYRGNPARNAGYASGPPLLEPFAQVETTSLKQTNDLFRQARASRPNGQPEGHPVAVGNRVIYRTALGVAALDLISGQKVWETPLEFTTEGLLRDPARKQQLLYWVNRYYRTGPLHLLIENSVNGTLTTDGQRVFAVDGLALPAPPTLLWEIANGGRPALFGTLKHWLTSNRLRALDLATGKPAWQVGGPAGTTAPELAEALFLGPPLPLDGSLWVLAEQRQKLMLFALDPATGKVRFLQEIGKVSDRIQMNLLRRCSAVHLSAADGLLFIPTHHGAIVAFDPVARLLVWAHTYADRPTPNFDEVAPELPQIRQMWDNGFHGGAPLLDSGRILLTGPDTQAIRCLHQQDGSLLWRNEFQPGDRFVATAHKGVVLVVGQNACRAIRLADGSALWQHAIPSPSGQGVRCGDTYWLPLREGGLLGIDLVTAQPPVRLGGPDSPVLGNLIVHAGMFWSQDTFRISAYPDASRRLLTLNELLEVNPENLPARLERAQLRLGQNQPRAAITDLRRVLGQANLEAPLRQRAESALYEALTRELQRQPAGAVAIIPEYLALSRVIIPSDAGAETRAKLERERLRRQMQVGTLVARVQAASGNPRQAAELLLGTLRVIPSELVPDPEDRTVDAATDLQLERTLRQIHAEATPDARRSIAQVLAQAATEPTGPAGSEALFRLARLADLLAPSERLALLRRLLQPPVPVGRVLLLLETLEDRLNAPDEVAAILYLRAETLTRVGLLHDAVACYQRLGREHATRVIHAGRTGADLLATARQDKRLLAVFEAPTPWDADRFTVREERAPGRVPPSPLIRLTDDHNFGFDAGPDVNDEPVRPLRSPSGSARTLRIAFDPVKRTIEVQNLAGESLWSTPTQATPLDPHIQGEPRGAYVVVGSLALVQVNNFLYGLDLLHREVLWAQRLIDPGRRPAEAFPGLTVSLQGRLEASTPDGNGWSVRAGVCGPLGAERALLQLQGKLVGLDPYTGRWLWVRRDIRPSNITGDASTAILLEKNPNDAQIRQVVAVRPSDGRRLPLASGTRDLVNTTACLRFLGGDILVWSDRQANGQRRLRRYDPISGRDRWHRDVPDSTRWLQSPSPDILGMSTQANEVRLLDLNTGKDLGLLLSLGQNQLADTMNHYVLSDDRHWYVVARKSAAEEGLAGDPSYHIAMTVPVMIAAGDIHAFDRTTGKRVWRASMPGQVLVRDPLETIPFLIGVADTTTDGDPPRGQRRIIRVRILDKATGKVLFNHEEPLRDDLSGLVRLPYFEMFQTPRYDPDANWLEIPGAAVRLRIEPANRR